MPVTYKKIASVTVTGATAANMEFTSIPGTYTDLILKISARANNTPGVVWTNIDMQFNNSGGTAYSGRLLYGDGSSVSVASNTNSDNARLQYASNNGATSSTFANIEVYIPGYAGGNNKSLLSDTVTENNATGNMNGLATQLWSSTNAITNIKLTPTSTSFLQYSTATLYGISKS